MEAKNNVIAQYTITTIVVDCKVSASGVKKPIFTMKLYGSSIYEKMMAAGSSMNISISRVPRVLLR
jgi:hypothetical protein